MLWILTEIIQALESLDSIPDYTFEVYDRAVVEPTEESWLDAIEWSRMHDFSHFLAYGSSTRPTVLALTKD